MARPSLKHVALIALAGAAFAGCGTEKIHLDSADSSNQQVQHGAQLFADKCAGCHTLGAAGTQGSATKVRDREHTDGPNFNQRREQMDAVLYAIRNGGFSGAIMPENIVVGQDANAIAAFVSKYAGRAASRPPAPGQAPVSNATTTPSGG